MNQQFKERFVQVARQRIDAWAMFYKPRLAQIQKLEDAYNNKPRKVLKGRFNIPLPILSGFIDTYKSKIDEFPTLNFARTKESDLKAAKKVTGFYQHQSGPDQGNWQQADRMAKHLSMFSGRGVYYMFSESKPKFRTVVSAVDYYDFIFEPRGGVNLENHRITGSLNIFRDKYEIQRGVESGIYDKGQALLLLNGATPTDQKETSQIMLEKNHRMTSMGLDIPIAEAYAGTAIFNLTQVCMEFEGERWYCLFDYKTGYALRLEKMHDVLGSDMYPYDSFSTNEDPFNFANKAPADDQYPVAEGMIEIFNQAMDNLAKRGYNMRAFNSNVFKNPSELKWKPEGLISAELEAGVDIRNAIMDLKTEDNSGSVTRLMGFLDAFMGKKSGITEGAQGQSNPDQKVAVYLGDMQQAAERIEYTSQMYRELHVRLGKRFVDGAKANISQKLAVQIIGTNGVEWDEIRKEELTEFDISITGGSAQKKIEEMRSQKQESTLGLIIKDPTLKARVNPDWLTEAVLRHGDFSDEEIKRALDINNFGDQEIMSEAAKAIEEILEGQKPKLNKGATSGFMQKIVDFAAENEVDNKTYDALMNYAMAHIDIATKNMERKAKSILATQQPGIMPQAPLAPAGAPMPPQAPGMPPMPQSAPVAAPMNPLQ